MLTQTQTVTSAGLATEDSFKLSLGCYAIAFVGTSICFYTQGKIGRRSPMLIGYIFMTVCMWTIGGLAFSEGSQIQWAQAVSLSSPPSQLTHNEIIQR